ncbi:MAG: hypothetical protein ACI8TF_000187 [Paracoccaceae bacterium]|jgi:hypothetical protein
MLILQPRDGFSVLDLGMAMLLVCASHWIDHTTVQSRGLASADLFAPVAFVPMPLERQSAGPYPD